MNAAKRFYKAASVRAEGEAFGVSLDERALRTPSGAVFLAPTHALARQCAEEWNAQEAQIAPHAMPLTRLVMAAIDSTRPRRTEIAAYVGSYAETDLLCHRADQPAALVARQAGAWDPLLAWARAEMGLVLPVVVGVQPGRVEEAMRRRVEAAAEAMDDFRLTALSQTAGIAGSAVIAFAFLAGRLDARAAFETAFLDELYSLETWGEDSEARARLTRIRREIEALGRFLAALS